MSPAVALLIAAGLIVANGLFVGVEFALLAAQQARLSERAGSSTRARAALAAKRQLPQMIAGCQFGITVSSLGLGAIAEPALAHLLEPLFHALHLPEAAVEIAAFAIALAFVSVLHMLLGEMVPKNLALASPERSAMLLAPVLTGFIRAFRPIIVALSAAATGILRLLGVEPMAEGGAVYTTEQIAALIAEARREGTLGRPEHTLLEDALTFERTTAASVVVPIDQVIAVGRDVRPLQIEEVVRDTGLSRFPVRADGNSNYAGYVHIGDVLVDQRSANRPIDPATIRELPDVPVEMPLLDVLTELQRSGAHLARAVNQQETVGIIALEDVLEVLVGEVHDQTRKT